MFENYNFSEDSEQKNSADHELYAKSSHLSSGRLDFPGLWGAIGNLRNDSNGTQTPLNIRIIAQGKAEIFSIDDNEFGGQFQLKTFRVTL